MKITLHNAKQIAPGLAAAIGIAIIAQGFSAHFGGPALLFALLLGMGCSFLCRIPAAVNGIAFSSRIVLHIGVALLGARMGIDTFLSLGIAPIFTVLAGVSLTILFGIWLSSRMGLPRQLGMLTGGAVGICGGSAALAISALLPQNEKTETHTLFTLVTTTLLSSTCMVLYPLLAKFLGMDDHHAGVLIGASIHDVAGAVGAGYTISPLAGDNATVVKLMRVALLVPVCLTLAFYLRRSTIADATPQTKIVFPNFLLAFIALAALASLHFLPEAAIRLATELSRWCLLVAIAALGMKTSLGKLRHVGLRPVLLMVAETLFLLAVVFTALHFY